MEMTIDGYLMNITETSPYIARENLNDMQFHRQFLISIFSTYAVLIIASVILHFLMDWCCNNPKQSNDALNHIEAPPVIPPTSDLDTLRIQKESIGQGGFGSVYCGNLNDRIVAIKIFSHGNKQYFFNERDIYMLPHMKHPSISEYIAGEKALEDFANLLASGEGSDVTVQIGDVEFQVHSTVLFARCPALSISLRHASREEVSKKIVVQDCEPNIFRDFLQYLYTGSIQSLTEQNVFGLYRVADKYLADDLKRLCLEHMENTLSIRTFCNIVGLALTHGESDLLERAVAFATGNILLILRSVEWQNFSLECPTEANELLIKSLGPLCESQTSKS